MDAKDRGRVIISINDKNRGRLLRLEPSILQTEAENVYAL